MRRFLAAHVSVSGNLGFNRTSWLEADAPPLAFLRARLDVLPRDASTKDAVSVLAESRSGVVALVDDGGRPMGTITALDLCSASGGAIGAQARPCPPTVTSPLSTRTAVREMLQSRSDCRPRYTGFAVHAVRIAMKRFNYGSRARLLSRWRRNPSAWGKPPCTPRARVISTCFGYHLSGCCETCA